VSSSKPVRNRTNLYLLVCILLRRPAPAEEVLIFPKTSFLTNLARGW